MTGDVDGNGLPDLVVVDGAGLVVVRSVPGGFEQSPREHAPLSPPAGREHLAVGAVLAYAPGVAQDARIELAEGDRVTLRFARRPRSAPLSTEALLSRIAALDVASVRRVRLHGTPASIDSVLRGVEALRARGIEHVGLDTDGAWLAPPGTAARLAAAGLGTLSVVVGGMRRRVHAAVAGEDSLADTLGAVREAVGVEGLGVYVVVPLLAWNREDVLPLLDYLGAASCLPTGLLLAPPEVRLVPEAVREALLSHGSQATLAARVFSECSRRRVEYGFFEKRGLLPCATGGALDRHGTVFVERLGLMKRRGEDESDRFVRVEACATCSLEQSCPGVDAAYVAHFGAGELRPVPLDVSMDWRLKPIHRLDERGLKSVSAFEHDPEGASGRSLVRVNGHCNMSCSFCFIDRTVPDLETEQLLAAIDRLAEGQRDHLVLSGGEPTLHPDLRALVRRGKERGFRVVEIQTNGVRAAEEPYARALVEAGLDKVTVSLHSVDAETSDEITRLPHAFHKTIRAMQHFRALGVETQVAHVITKRNFAELPATVRFLRETFPPGGGTLSICFGIAQPISDLVYTWVMPRFDEVRPFMKDALDYCLANDVGFGGMIGQGGYPPCMLDGDLRYYERNLGNVYTSDGGGSDFVKPEKCQGCSFDPWCLGVRRDYVETYGDAEVRPFQANVSAYAPPNVSPRFARPDPNLVQLRRRA